MVTPRVLCLRVPRLYTLLPTCLFRRRVKLSDLGFRSSLCYYLRPEFSAYRQWDNSTSHLDHTQEPSKSRHNAKPRHAQR